MKKFIVPFIIALMIAISTPAISQDTTSISNFKITVRMSAILSTMLTADDDLYYEIRKADKLAGFPALSDTLTIDSVSVNDLVIIYDRLHGLNFGTIENSVAWFKQLTAGSRLVNNNLNSKMIAIEIKWNDVFISLRQYGLNKQRKRN